MNGSRAYSNGWLLNRIPEKFFWQNGDFLPKISVTPPSHFEQFSFSSSQIVRSSEYDCDLAGKIKQIRTLLVVLAFRKLRRISERSKNL